MPTATWRGAVIAQSDLHDVEIVEGNIYFPRKDVRADLLRPSEKTTTCSWKGECNYFDVVVDGEVNKDAAWVYENPLPKAQHVKGRVAFWRGVEVKK